MKPYEFTATEFEADPDAVRLAFGSANRYVWMQPDEEDYDDVRPSPDAQNVWLEIEDQAWGGHGGIAGVKLDRACLTVWRTNPPPSHAGGHDEIIVQFEATDDEFQRISQVLRAVFRGNERLVDVTAAGT